MASKPKSADAIRNLLKTTTLPVVGTFQAAGAISREEFACFGGRVGQIANQPADALLESGDVVITIGYDAVEYWPSLWNKGDANLDGVVSDRTRHGNSCSPLKVTCPHCAIHESPLPTRTLVRSR
jgi:thiamine pyrophosphate-dependent acetolactate synthase large subunit-like protein